MKKRNNCTEEQFKKKEDFCYRCIKCIHAGQMLESDVSRCSICGEDLFGNGEVMDLFEMERSDDND